MEQLPTKLSVSHNPDIPFPEEIEHLDFILAQLNKAMQNTVEAVERHDREYNESKRYMAEYRHEIDPKEIFQNELSLKDIERAGIIAVKERDRLAKLLQSPYFARIDFCMDGEPDADVYYIGRFTFTRGSEFYVYDWRAPIAGMFYDCELGKAGYDAPIGRIDGELTRKRQFKIAKGRMEFAFESSMNIRDEVLQRELSSTSQEKMKTIISTLQREQNVIIRDDKAGTMIIQGVAGSGKTSIALHRIAYLLYKYKETLSAKNVVILSPNKVFSNYISTVLPELGEEPIYEMSFSDVAEAQLDGMIEFEPDKDPLEYTDLSWVERVKYKSTLDFIIELDEYMDDISNTVFDPADYEFGRFIAPADWIWRRYEAYRKFPIKKRLEEIASDISDKFASENYMEEELPRERTILKGLNAMLRIKDTLSLYKDFYKHIGRPELFVMPQKKTLEWTDVYPFIYLHAFYAGLKENKVIRHLLIDEMQDYTPIQYEVMNLLFQCQKTILGDFGQLVNPNNQNSLADMAQIYGEGNVIELNKSYRSSYEIICFAKRILNVVALEPVERHGEEVKLLCCRDRQDEISAIKNRMDDFDKSSNVTLGIITKTNRDALVLYNLLTQSHRVNLITPDSDQFHNGITVTSVQMSKGLEFDEVIIPYACKDTYHSEIDRNLLYIACTRAMHKLVLLYSGAVTPLIDGCSD